MIFPITKQRSYVHFEYHDSLINKDSPIVKYEDKLTKLASKGWKKITDSEKNYNKKIVYYINKFLESAPWCEDSLRSIPSESALLRQKEKTGGDRQSSESSTNAATSALSAASELESETPSASVSQTSEARSTSTDSIKHTIIKPRGELKPAQQPAGKKVEIPVYYPSSIRSESALRNELISFARFGQRYHKSQMLITGILIPFTIPFIIVPVVPNIPGFYLAYRFYCNFKAYLGAQHLQELIKLNDLKFVNSKGIDEIYHKNSPSALDSNILMNEDIITNIVNQFDAFGLKNVLAKALKQEIRKTSLKA